MEEDKTEDMFTESAPNEHITIPEEFKYLIKVLMCVHLGTEQLSFFEIITIGRVDWLMNRLFDQVIDLLKVSLI